MKPDQRAVVSGTLVSLAVDHGHSAAAQISVTARLNCPPPSAPAKSLVGAELRGGRFGGIWAGTSLVVLSLRPMTAFPQTLVGRE